MDDGEADRLRGYSQGVGLGNRKKFARKAPTDSGPARGTARIGNDISFPKMVQVSPVGRWRRRERATT